MSLGIDFGAFGATNPFTGNTPFTAIDTFNAALENNGASQPLGSLYFLPINAAGVPIAPATIVPGQGLQLALKYVRYNPTTSQAIQAGPGLVYWKDETFTTVTPLAAEAFNTTNSVNSEAGWLGYNTTTLPSATAASINGNFAWIVVGGFIAGAYLGTGSTAAAGVPIVAAGSAGAAWTTSATVAAGNRIAAYTQTAVNAALLADIYVPFSI